MRTLYIDPNLRVSWQRPTQYRPYFGLDENPKSRVLWLGWLVLEMEWYNCTMTKRGPEHREPLNARPVI